MIVYRIDKYKIALIKELFTVEIILLLVLWMEYFRLYEEMNMNIQQLKVIVELSKGKSLMEIGETLEIT